MSDDNRPERLLLGYDPQVTVHVVADTRAPLPAVADDEELEAAEERRIDEAYRGVAQAYLHSNHRKKIEIIERAYRFARHAHAGVRRRSGEPYILHPIAVAQIVISELGLGSTSICAALLHDVVEDTEYTLEDIEASFGSKIASIVDGLTKISGGIFGNKASLQAENFRKLLLSMSTDVRVVLIKMADRLHNMRTLGSLRPEKQYKIAGETLYVYAPLAHRLGLFKIKQELEDLAFRYEHPGKYAEIMSLIEQSEEARQRMVEEFVAPVREKLDAAGFRYEIKARVKSAYSIYRKMERKKLQFQDIYDVYAVRVVFDNDDDDRETLRCWQIYTFFAEGHRLHPGVGDSGHAVGGDVAGGQSAVQGAVLVDNGDGGYLLFPHDVPGPVHGDRGVQGRGRIIVQVLHLGADVLHRPGGLEAEAVQHPLGLVADVVHMGGHIVPVAQGVAQGRVGHGGHDGIGIGVVVADDVDLVHRIQLLSDDSIIKRPQFVCQCGVVPKFAENRAP